MEVTIGEFAKMVGSTVRTLRYYDKIGLLTPKKYNQNGRKVYTRLDLDLFQQIMILKHIGLSLTEIKDQMTNEQLKKRDLLLVQKRLIEQKQAELNDMLEVINRMDRLYYIEGVSEEELNEFSFIMLDLFRREKSQIRAYEKYFQGDKGIMKQIKLLHDPEYKEKMDIKVWHLLQAIRIAIQHNDSSSRKKVQEILNEMDSLFPSSRTFLSLAEDENFFAEHNQEFNNYLPEDIAEYMLQEVKAYYGDKESSKGES